MLQLRLYDPTSNHNLSWGSEQAGRWSSDQKGRKTESWIGACQLAWGASPVDVDGGDMDTAVVMRTSRIWKVRCIAACCSMMGVGCGAETAVERSGIWKGRLIFTWYNMLDCGCDTDKEVGRNSLWNIIPWYDGYSHPTGPPPLTM